MGLRMLCTRIALRTSVFPNSRFNSARVEQDGSRVCLFCVPLDTPLPLFLRPPPHLHRDGGPCPSAECLRICLASCCPEWAGATPQLVVPVRPGGGRLVDVVDGTRSGAGARHSGPPLRPGSPQRSVTGLRVYGVPPTPPGPSEWMHLEPVFHAAIAGIIILPSPSPSPCCWSFLLFIPSTKVIPVDIFIYYHDAVACVSLSFSFSSCS